MLCGDASVQQPHILSYVESCGSRMASNASYLKELTTLGNSSTLGKKINNESILEQHIVSNIYICLVFAFRVSYTV